MTRLTDTTQAFYEPTFQPQGPDSRCIVHGIPLGWDSCTMYAGAMAVDSTTQGRIHPSGCTLRTRSGDTSGGTTLRQMADAVLSVTGIVVATYTGANVLTPERVAAYIRAGRKCVIQGNADAMIGTPFQSTAGAVNHAVMLNAVYGGTVSHPDRASVFDPAADGRPRPYHVDQGPSVWPWSLVLKFAANLRPAGTGPRLGPGKMYVAVFPDSEPHVKLRTGAIRTNPFPDRARAARDIGIYNAPSSASKRLYGIKDGTVVVGYQRIEGNSSWGSTWWTGNDDGTEWVPSGALKYLGGSS